MSDNNNQEQNSNKKNKKIKKKFNIFDLAFAFVVLIIIFFACFFIFKNHIFVSKNKKIIFFTVEILQIENSLADKIKVKDKVFDNVKNFYYGEISDVKVKAAIKITEDNNNGNFVLSEITDRKNIDITIKCCIDETDDDFFVDNNSIKVGKFCNLKSKNFRVSGYIIDIII